MRTILLGGFNKPPFLRLSLVLEAYICRIAACLWYSMYINFRQVKKDIALLPEKPRSFCSFRLDYPAMEALS